MDLKKLAKKEWYLEHFDGCPAFAEMTGWGLSRQLYKSKIPAYSINPCYYHERQGDWFSLPSDHKLIGATIINGFIKNKNFLTGLHRQWLKNFSKLLNFYYEAITADLSTLTDDELLAWTEKVYSLYYFTHVPGFIDGYMFYADKRFDFLIRQFCAERNLKNSAEIFSVLSANVEPSFINEEENELKRISKLPKKVFENKLKSHLFKYSWIKSSYAGYKEYAAKEAKKEIKDISIAEAKEKNIFLKHKKDKEKLIKKYKFTKEILAVAKSSEVLIKWQDQRKIYTLTFATLQEKILKEASRRHKLDLELLRYCRNEDVKKAISGRIDLNELKRRQKGCLFIYGTKELYVSEKARNFFKKASAIKFKKTDQIQGMAASVGRARGKVKVMYSIEDLHKIKKGDILVTSMTRPEHLPGMKKAAAIVTDDGGITCHAAIVSRELGIPCVIGTKIATKVLHDGDLVEADADRGVIRIINK